MTHLPANTLDLSKMCAGFDEFFEFFLAQGEEYCELSRRPPEGRWATLYLRILVWAELGSFGMMLGRSGLRAVLPPASTMLPR